MWMTDWAVRLFIFQGLGLLSSRPDKYAWNICALKFFSDHRYDKISIYGRWESIERTGCLAGFIFARVTTRKYGQSRRITTSKEKILHLSTCLKMVAAIMFLALANVTSLAAAEAMPRALIAIVDVNHVLSNSTALKEAKQTFQDKEKLVSDELKLERDVLLEEKKQLDLQQAILAPGVYIQKTDELNERGRQLQRRALEIRGQINKALNVIATELRKRITEIAISVGKKRGANIGMDRAITVFFDNTLDITAEVLTAFNKANPKLNITIEKK